MFDNEHLLRRARLFSTHGRAARICGRSRIKIDTRKRPMLCPSTPIMAAVNNFRLFDLRDGQIKFTIDVDEFQRITVQVAGAGAPSHAAVIFGGDFALPLAFPAAVHWR